MFGRVKLDSLKPIALIALCVMQVLLFERASAKTLKFSGYEWTVVDSPLRGPGPNRWDSNNVWVDAAGKLHLKVASQNGLCHCAELFTQKRLGFGRYQFQIDSRIDNLDANLVAGFFLYPTKDTGPDGTDEMDIEFSRWGDEKKANLNYTVWPVNSLLQPGHSKSHFTLATQNQYSSLHSFTRKPDSVAFQSLLGLVAEMGTQVSYWLYQPVDPVRHISQSPLPFHINLWCFQGKEPASSVPTEVIIRSFSYQPL